MMFSVGYLLDWRRLCCRLLLHHHQRYGKKLLSIDGTKIQIQLLFTTPTRSQSNGRRDGVWSWRYWRPNWLAFLSSRQKRRNGLWIHFSHFKHISRVRDLRKCSAISGRAVPFSYPASQHWQSSKTNFCSLLVWSSALGSSFSKTTSRPKASPSTKCSERITCQENSKPLKIHWRSASRKSPPVSERLKRLTTASGCNCNPLPYPHTSPLPTVGTQHSVIC